MDRDPADIAALERLLRASRPHPDPRFVGQLEEHLLPPKPEPRRRARRPLLAAAGATAALAVAVVGLGLAGGGPLAPSGDDGVRAKDDCRFVPVRERVRSPFVVSGRDGRAEVRYRSRVVTRQVKRCR
jgi:ferric-dicitrate binding protein FerR (iron transport regulator)